jgi:hypothetical protein
MRHMKRLILGTLLVLWCLSWLPSVAFALSEGPPGAPEPMSTVRALCLLNFILYYAGGLAWLILKSFQSDSLVCVFLAWCVFLFLNPFGPVVLVICKCIFATGQASIAHGEIHMKLAPGNASYPALP